METALRRIALSLTTRLRRAVEAHRESAPSELWSGVVENLRGQRMAVYARYGELFGDEALASLADECDALFWEVN
jgi:hypothetical protein